VKRKKKSRFKYLDECMCRFKTLGCSPSWRGGLIALGAMVKADNPPWLTPHVLSRLIEFYVCFQIADQLPWISLTPQESFA